MAVELRQKLTISDAMLLVAAAAFGAWGAVAYRVFPLPFVYPTPGWLPLLEMSVPVAAALTVGFLLVPVRTLRQRTRRVSRQPGTALCLAATIAMLAISARWTIRAWIAPYVDGSLWIYGAWVVIESAKWCGLVVVAAAPVLVPGGRFCRQGGWIEWARLTLVAYWLIVFLVFIVLI